MAGWREKHLRTEKNAPHPSLPCPPAQVAAFVDEAAAITLDIKAKCGPKLKDFKDYLAKEVPPSVKALKAKVEAFAMGFPTIGFEKATMRYKS